MEINCGKENIISVKGFLCYKIFYATIVITLK